MEPIVDFYFRETWRMDWGFENPNITAALIAMLMIAVWWLPWLRRSLFWVSVVLFTALGVCLIHTFSRGGVVALSAGGGFLLWFAPRPWPRSRTVAIILSLLILVSASIYLGANARYARSLPGDDRSVGNRLKIWQHVPQMMVDAPEGWGRGQAAWAFMQWYQDVDAPETYLNLVSSHCTWLVELSWSWRFAYIFGWGAILMLCWPSQRLRWSTIPLGVWITFLVAASFTHVAQSHWIWVTPGLALVIVIAGRLVSHSWPTLRGWLGVTGVTVVAIAAAVISTMFMNPKCKIAGTPFGAAIGSANPATWVIGDPKVLGQQPGKTLRRYIQQTPAEAVGFSRSLAAIPPSALNHTTKWVVAGSLNADDLEELRKLVAANQKVVCLNPWFYPIEAGLTNSPEKPMVHFGNFSQSPARSSWESLQAAQVIDGAGEFLPNWPQIISSSL